MRDHSALTLDDVVISRVAEGHQLFVVAAPPAQRLTLLYQGNAWSPQYAAARGAKLAARKGGALWYTTDHADTFEYLETFRADKNDDTDLARLDDDGVGQRPL